MDQESVDTRSAEVITHKFPQSPVSEAFRSIRTNISYLSPDKVLKSILVTSGDVGDGKSIVITNLAVSFAQNNNKVILIDADIRRPMIHRFFEKTNLSGLSNLLTGETTFEEVLKEVEIDNLSIISAGTKPPNPAELLSSKRMDEIIKKAREMADLVFIDSPPATMVTDPVVLSHKVDGVILVVASHETSQEALKSAQENLKKGRANIIGTVLNKYPLGKKGYYNRYYYGYS